MRAGHFVRAKPQPQNLHFNRGAARHNLLAPQHLPAPLGLRPRPSLSLLRFPPPKGEFIVSAANQSLVAATKPTRSSSNPKSVLSAVQKRDSSKELCHAAAAEKEK